MLTQDQVAKHVRVKLNENWFEKCIGDNYLAQEKVLYIREKYIYNDTRGHYVNIEGGSGTISGYAYLDQLDLEFPIR